MLLPEEQEVLASYVGWGGLADAFDPDKGNWSQEYHYSEEPACLRMNMLRHELLL